MIPPDKNRSLSANSGFLRLLTVLVTIAMAWILLPFYGTIMWGAIIALLFAPVYRRMLPRLRRRRTLAALLTLLLVLVGDVNPGRYFRGLFEALPAWVTAWLDRFGLFDFNSLQARLSELLAQGSKFIATQALNIGQNTFQFVVSIFIALYLAFFLIRDGETISRALQRAIPLAPPHKQELLQKFATVIRATVKGNLLVALIQGSLGGLAFWFLGIKGGRVVGCRNGVHVITASRRRGPGLGAGRDLFPCDRRNLAGPVFGRLRCVGNRIGRQLAATNPGWQGHAHARLRGDDLNPGRHDGVRHQRLRARADDRGHVHRSLANLR